MAIKLANNASGTLATAINASDTGIALTTGDGTEFPTLGVGDYFYATITSTQGTQEIVKVTARSGDSLTVVRAQEGTSAAGFAAGARFELRVTAASVDDVVEEVRTEFAATSGSSLVGFLQSGSGATARTVQAKLRDQVSVKDFGAVGDGVADDTAAFTAALAAADVVFVPSGTYAVSQIVLTGSGSSPIYGKTIRGDGLGVSTIRGTVAGTSIIRYGTAGGWVDEANLQGYRAYYCGLENIRLDATANYTYGIECQWLTDSCFKNVTISSGGKIGTGFYLDFSWDNDFEHLSIAANNGIVCGAHSPNRNSFHGLRLAGGGAGAGNKYGLDVAGSGNSFFGFDISAYDYGVISSNGLYGLSLQGGYFEANTYDISFGGGGVRGVSISGCIFGLGAGANVGVRQSGPSSVEGVQITGCAFRSKTNAVILTTPTYCWMITGNQYTSCANIVTKAGYWHVIDDYAGNLSVRSVLDLSDATSAGQIKFPATQNASSDANTLDDYEESTWTPASNGDAFASATGRYTKIGDVVVATFIVQYPVTVNSGTAQITGWPFAASGANSEHNGLSVGYNTSAKVLGGSLAGSTFTFRSNGASGVTITNANLSGATISGVVTYKTAT